MAKKNKFSPRSYAWTILVIFLTAGWFYPVIGLMALVCMFAPIIAAALSGRRKWCALFCPRGIFNDVILKKITRNIKPPAFITSTAFKVAVLVFLMANLIIGLIRADNLAEAGFVFVRLVSITTAIAIVLGFYYQQRAWCGFCPMGFLASLTIRARQILGKKRQQYQLRKQYNPGKITVFIGNDCPPCREIKTFLTDKGINFTLKNIDENKDAREEMIETYESTSVPTVVIDGKVYQGILPTNLDSVLKEIQNKTAKKVS